MIRSFLKIYFVICIFAISNSFASPIISGISTNEINIDTQFRGTQILLFGAKGDAGNIVIALRGPKKDFIITKKQKLLGIWYNGQRVKFDNNYSFYSLFSTFSEKEEDQNLLSDLELGSDNIKFKTISDFPQTQIKDFELHLIEQLEKQKLYSRGAKKIDFLDETLFKVILDFPKNIARGIYTVEIYLIQEGSLLSFQAIPIYVNQVGFSARIFDFANQESFLYGICAVLIALVIGWLTNYLFARFMGK